MPMLRKREMILVVATAIVAGGCATLRRVEARDTGELLMSAGFKAQPADTPEQTQRLHAMPPLKLVSQPEDGGIVYRYADPFSCDCLYVGDEQSYAEYRCLAAQRETADERLAAENEGVRVPFAARIIYSSPSVSSCPDVDESKR